MSVTPWQATRMLGGCVDSMLEAFRETHAETHTETHAELPANGMHITEQPRGHACRICGSSELRSIEAEACIVCSRCGTSYDLNTYTLTFDEHMERSGRRNSCSYKHLGHFMEHVRRLEGLGDKVDASIIGDVKYLLRLHGMDPTRALPGMVKAMLKKLGRSDLYDQRFYIAASVSGQPLPTITPDIKQELYARFQQLFSVWRSCKPTLRRNFMSYPYVLCKLLELLEQDGILIYLQLLKSDDKLLHHDASFKKACERLGWEFIPTL